MSINKTDKRAVRSRYQLASSLIQLLKNEPLESITVTKLIAHAGYSRTAFYNNYKDIKDCLDTIIEEQTESLMSAMLASWNNFIKATIEADSSRESIYELICRAPYEEIYANKDVFIVICSKLPKEYMYSFVNKIAIMASDLKDYDVCGVSPNEINVKLYMWSYIWDTFGRVLYWIKHGMIYSPEYMGHQQFLAYMDGTHLVPKDKK